MKNIYTITILSFLVTGCSQFLESPKDETYKSSILSTNESDSSIKISYTQWNKDYAITTKKALAKTTIKPDYVCSTGCELVFFKHPFNQYDWKQPAPFEKLIAVGYHPSLFGNDLVKLPGKDLNKSLKSENYATNLKMHMYFKDFINNNNEQLQLMTIELKEGMAGGPVYSAEDSSLVGMSVGSGKDAISGLYYGFYLPFDVINKEWKIFQTQQHK